MAHEPADHLGLGETRHRGQVARRPLRDVGRGSSVKPGNRRTRNRSRHLHTLLLDTLGRLATARLVRPSAHANTRRDRSATRCAVVGRRAHYSNVQRSSSVSNTGLSWRILRMRRRVRAPRVPVPDPTSVMPSIPPRPSYRLTPPEIALQFLLEDAAALHTQAAVNRFVRDLHVHILRIRALQPPRDLLWGPIRGAGGMPPRARTRPISLQDAPRFHRAQSTRCIIPPIIHRVASTP